MIKLVVSDMDGTLLDAQGNTPQELPRVLDKLHEQGILFAVASGRQYHNLVEIFSNVRDRIVFICENGALVVYQGEVLSSKPMDPNLMLELVEMGRRTPGFDTLVCGENSAWHETWNLGFQEEVLKYYSRVKAVKKFELVPEPVVKVTFWHPEGPVEDLQHSLGPLPLGIKSMVSGFNFLDCLAAGVNKGQAVSDLQGKFSITREQTMVFGDYLNDLEMMTSAYHSYAMANAHPLILATARFKAPGNTENGVIQTLWEKVLQGLR